MLGRSGCAQNDPGAGRRVRDPARWSDLSVTRAPPRWLPPGRAGSRLTARSYARDAPGRFAGGTGFGKNAKAEGLRLYTLDTGRTVITKQVRATLPDGTMRYYGGLALKADGTSEGIEVKSGTAGQCAQPAQVRQSSRLRAYGSGDAQRTRDKDHQR